MIDATPVGRSAGDILSRTIRLTLGGTEYELPTLPIAGNRRWLAKLDAELTSVLAGLRKANRVGEGLVALLAGQIDQMLDLIVFYDTTGVLPPREALLEVTYEAELYVAVQEVWRAANPLVAMAIENLQKKIAARTSASSQPTSSPPPSTAGSRRRSRKN